MSALVVDTSSWISWLAGNGDTLIDEALGEGRLYLPAVVAAELLSGTLNEQDRTALEDLLRDLPLCSADVGHWFRVGRLRGSLRKAGVTLSTPDAHVAQCVLDLDGELLTEDRVFEKVAEVTGLQMARPPGRDIKRDRTPS